MLRAGKFIPDELSSKDTGFKAGVVWWPVFGFFILSFLLFVWCGFGGVWRFGVFLWRFFCCFLFFFPFRNLI